MMKRPPVIALASALAAVLLTAGWSPVAQAQKKTCHLLIFADTKDPRIGVSVRRDVASIRRVFGENIPAAQAKGVTVSGDELTRDNMIKTIREHAVQPIDTLIVYFAGHGAYQRDTGHMVRAGSTREQFVKRTTLRMLMRERGARLNVLITDCCSNVVQFDAPKEATQLLSVKSVQDKASAAFIELCWKPAGFVDIYSAKRGQIAAGDEEDGGFFTYSLTRFLSENRERKVDWQQVIRAVGAATSARYQEKHPRGITYGRPKVLQKTQDPEALLETDPLPPAEGPTAPRFGVRVLERNGRLVITEVVPGSPASRVRLATALKLQKLETGDTLLEIDGQSITTQRQYEAAVDRADRRMWIRIRNHRDQQAYLLAVILAR